MKKSTLWFVTSCLVFITFSTLLYITTPNPDSHVEIDSEDYELVAQHYAVKGDIAHPQHGMPAHTIGYYWFLGTIYSLFGNNQTYVFLAQILLALVCMWLLYCLTWYLFGKQVALIASMLASCNIGFLVYSQLIMAEIVLLIFLISFLYAFTLFVYKQKKMYCLLSAVSLSMSVLVKPVALFYALVLFLFVWFAHKGTVRSKIMSCCLFATFFYVPLLGYMYYNYKKFNVFAVTVIPAVNIYDYFLPRRILPRLELGIAKEISEYIDASKDYAEHTQRSREVLIDLLKKYPFTFVQAITQSMIKILFGLYATQLKMMYNTAIRGGACSYFAVEGSHFFERLYNYALFGATTMPIKIIALIELSWIFIQYFLVCCALFFLVYNRHYFWILFWGTYIGYFDFAACFDGCGRYRMMLEPIFIMLIAYALMQLYSLIKKSAVHCTLKELGMHV